MLNHFTGMGRLTRDPELKTTPAGISVASFAFAVERDFAEGGEKKTDFIDVVAWRQTAEFVSKYFTKGRMVVVEGRLQIREWQDKEGNKRRSAEINADNVYFGDAKRDGEGGGAPSGSYSGGSNPSSGGGYDRGGSYPGPTGGYAPPPMGSAGNEFGDIADDDGELPF